MLYDVNSGREITSIPHNKDYQKWKKSLGSREFQNIAGELNKRIDKNEIHTSSWMPGSDWTNTPFQPIYETCNGDLQNSAKFFGLILWEVMLERPEYWSFGRYKKDGIEIVGLTYFQVDI